MSNENDKENTNKWFSWKGKRVSQKIYYQRLNQKKAGKLLNLFRRESYSILKKKFDESQDRNEYLQIQERRYMHVSELGKNLKCCKCKSTLSLEKITNQKIMGMATIFYIKCSIPDCNTITEVATDKKHPIKNNIQKTGKLMLKRIKIIRFYGAIFF